MLYFSKDADYYRGFLFFFYKTRDSHQIDTIETEFALVTFYAAWWEVGPEENLAVTYCET